MRTYETGILLGREVDDFIDAFDAAIGTETETCQHSRGEFTVTCFELESSEVQKARTIENRIKFNKGLNNE